MDEARFLQETGERNPPAGLLARLRAIHPRAELVDVGSEWWLGLVEPNPYRRRTGQRLMARLTKDADPDPGDLRLARLLLADFTLVAKYAEADGAMVEDFRRRDWQFKHDPAADSLRETLRQNVADKREARRAWWRSEAQLRAREATAMLRGRLLLPVTGLKD